MPIKEQEGTTAGRWSSPYQFDTLVLLAMQVFPEGFRPRCEKQLTLLNLLNLPGSLLDRPQLGETELANGRGPGVDRGCLNTINSKGREECDGFGYVPSFQGHCLDNGTQSMDDTGGGGGGLHSVLHRENIYQGLTVCCKGRGHVGSCL